MYCELCKKNIATIHYTKIVNGHKEERHVCEQCASQLKEPMKPLLHNEEHTPEKKPLSQH